jgi:hypothetical protein
MFKKVLRDSARSGILFLNLFSYLQEAVVYPSFPYLVAYYLGYLVVALAITVWVSRILQSSGRVFLLDACRGDAELASSVNRLLTVGFYLINVGYIACTINTYQPLNDPRQIIEMETTKLGGILLVQGIMHTVNIFLLTRVKQRAANPVAAVS